MPIYTHDMQATRFKDRCFSGRNIDLLYLSHAHSASIVDTRQMQFRGGADVDGGLYQAILFLPCVLYGHIEGGIARGARRWPSPNILNDDPTLIPGVAGNQEQSKQK